MENIAKTDKRLSNELQDKTNELVDNIEHLINNYEYETGLSVKDAKITFNEHDCTKEVHLLIDYYNFDNSMVRRIEE